MLWSKSDVCRKMDFKNQSIMSVQLLFALTNTGNTWANVFQLIVETTKPSLGWKIAYLSLWMRYCYEDNKEFIYM